MRMISFQVEFNFMHKCSKLFGSLHDRGKKIKLIASVQAKDEA